MTAPAKGRRGTPRRSPAGAATLEAAARVELRQANDTIDLLTMQLENAERAGGNALTEAAGTAQLERQIVSDPGWRLFSILTAQEFTAEGLTQLRAVCRLMGIKNPLIKRGLDLRMVYVHGQGCEIRARANGASEDAGEQDVDGVVDAFVTDPANQRAVFGQQAAGEQERALGTDGELFIALFTRPRSGWVQARTFSADEIVEIITNPDDKSEPWYYRRQWQREGFDQQGQRTYELQEVLYPDIDYRPRSRPSAFAGVKVDWWAPVVQVSVNRPLNWLRGIPDAYAAVDWARAYKEFLEQWATLMKALSKFAWRLTVDGKQRTQAKAAIAAAGTATRTITGEANDVAGTALTPLGATLEAIPKSGATIDAESGRPIAMMVAAALNVPVTMLLADPGQTGARATAETLDWPTELGMRDRRELWTTVRKRIVRYVITESVRAPHGLLKGTIKRDPVTEREVVELAGDTDDTIDVIWPDLDDVEASEVIAGIVAANTTGTLPPEFVLRQLLIAIGVRDVDSIVAEMVDEESGAFQWPQTAATAGQAAATAARTGGDPAAAGMPGSMTPDAPPGQPGQAGPVDEQGSAPVPADGPAGRMADADFGLFGSGAEPDPVGGPPPPAGAKPAAGTFDAAFFTIGATGAVDEEDQDVPDDQLISEAAAGRMADADFGLFGSPPPDEDDDEQDAGDKPDPGQYDPSFFAIP